MSTRFLFNLDLDQVRLGVGRRREERVEDAAADTTGEEAKREEQIETEAWVDRGVVVIPLNHFP